MRREAKIGFFLGGAVLILAIFIFIVGDLSVLFRKPGYELFTAFDSASGLETRAAVRMAGVKIGYVKDIRLVGRRAQVEMSISPEYKVPKGSRATLASLGLIGERYIEIMPGEETSAFQAGEMIDSAPSASLDQVGTLLLGVADDIKEVGRSIREMTGEESRASLQNVLRNLDAFSRDLDGFMSQNRDNLETGIRHASQAAKEFEQRIKEVSQSVEETVSLLKNIAQENRETVKLNLEKIKELLARLEESLRQVSESLDKINRGEGTLGKLINDPRLYDEAGATLDSVRKTVEPLTRMRAAGNSRFDYLSETRKVKSTLSLNLYLTPRYFVSGQVVEDPLQNTFTYSAQGGLRWGSVASRVGIFESAFGAGVDVLALGDRLIFSLEGFDFARHGGPRLRFATQYFLLRYFYLVAGWDDFGWRARREIYFGLGLGTR
ncbi:MAG: MlaD family protein [Clostridiales bacterium]|nr:MlaD family protein [Clostridiales bacterium]